MGGNNKIRNGQIKIEKEGRRRSCPVPFFVRVWSLMLFSDSTTT